MVVGALRPYLFCCLLDVIYGQCSASPGRNDKLCSMPLTYILVGVFLNQQFICPSEVWIYIHLGSGQSGVGVEFYNLPDIKILMQQLYSQV